MRTSDVDVSFYTRRRRLELAVENRKLNPYGHDLPDTAAHDTYIALPWGGFQVVSLLLAPTIKAQIVEQENVPNDDRDYTTLFRILQIL